MLTEKIDIDPSTYFCQSVTNYIFNQTVEQMKRRSNQNLWPQCPAPNSTVQGSSLGRFQRSFLLKPLRRGPAYNYPKGYLIEEKVVETLQETSMPH
jgi:hypothetical protein